MAVMTFVFAAAVIAVSVAIAFLSGFLIGLFWSRS